MPTPESASAGGHSRGSDLSGSSESGRTNPRQTGGTSGGGARLVMALVGVAAALLALQGISHYSALIAPVFFALNMVIIVHPLHNWLVRRFGWPRWAAAVASLLAVLIALFAFFYSIGWAVFALIQALPQYSSDFETMWNDSLTWLEQFGVTTEGMVQNLQDNVGNVVSFSTEWLVGIASNLSGLAAMLAIIVTVLFFLSVDSMTISRRVRVILGQNPTTARALLNFAAGVRRYWVVTTVFGLIVAVMDLGYLAILGIPLAGVWAVLAFVSNYIPNVGFVIGVVPPTLMGLLAGGWMDALLVVVGFSVINMVMQSFVQPKFTGDAIGVTPTISFLSVLLWAAVLGPLGALLALPATLLVKAILVDPNPQVRFVNALIAATPEDGLPTERAHEARAARSWLNRWITGSGGFKRLGKRPVASDTGSSQAVTSTAGPTTTSEASDFPQENAGTSDIDHGGPRD